MLRSLLQPIRLLPLLAVGVLVSAVQGVSTVHGAPAQGPLGVIGGETLEVVAEKLEMDVDRGTAVLTGKVQAKLGEVQVECPRVEVRYDSAPNVRFARGTGGIRAAFRDISAKAQSVEVDVVKRQMTFSGGVELMRGRGWVRAERASIDLGSRKVSLDAVTGSIPVQPPAR